MALATTPKYYGRFREAVLRGADGHYGSKKSYTALKVRLLLNPPQSSSVMNATKKPDQRAGLTAVY